MAFPAERGRPWPILIGLYLFAVAVNLVGITWGLPGHDGGLLPPAPPAAVTEGTERSWAAARDPKRNLSVGAPEQNEEETPARALRRFYLFTSDPDESVTIMALARLNPLAGRWDPGIAHYGGFYLYTLGAWLKLAAAGGFITARGDPAFYIMHSEAMGRIYLAGRLLVLLVACLAVPLVWILARSLYGFRTAVLAAGAAAVAPAWIVLCHIIKPWAFGVPFALAALAMGRRLVESASPRRDAVWAGVFAGLADGAGLPYGPFILAPWVGIALRRGKDGAGRLACAALAGGAAVLVVAIAHPYWFLNPWGTVAAYRRLFSAMAWDYRPTVLLAFAWGTVGTAIGLPLVVAGFAEGILLAWRSRAALPVLVPTAALLLSVAVKTGEAPGAGLFARWALPAAMVLAMLGVGGLSRLAGALPRPIRLLPALLVIPTLLISAGVLRHFLAETGTRGTRHLAGAWLNTLPEGTSLGVLGPLAPFRSPFFRLDRYRLVIEDEPDRLGDAALPEYFLMAERSTLPASPAFRARYREVRRFLPPSMPLGSTAFEAYPFADPPITIYARRNPGE